jgi:pimeloyl-ACP methyl ester carboxylesterase
MGADSRIFKSFKFPWNATYLEWIEPQDGETLSAYADRLLDRYPIKENDLLFGYSFGGIIAQDWASRNKVQRVVLLNSLHHEATLRPLYRNLASTGVLSWAPKGSIFKLIKLIARLNSKPSRQLDLLLETMEQFDCQYYRWVLRAVLDWERPTPLAPVDVILGELDPVFTIQKPSRDRFWVLKGATHLSFTSHSNEISNLLKEKVDPVLA